MKYIIGDKVRIRKDLVVSEVYGEYRFVDSMKPYMGKTMTISHVNDYAYHLKEDSDEWNWTDEMFEDVEAINILVDGNKVIANRGDKVGIARCSPEDEFDIFTGVRLALDRLEEKCKPYGWLKEDVRYYIPRVDTDDLFDGFIYQNDKIDERHMSRGLVFKTKEEAIEVAKKMLEVVK